MTYPRQGHIVAWLKGASFNAPALVRLSPVTACTAWVELADLREEPVFHSLDRWGYVSAANLHINSLVPLLRSIFTRAGFMSAEKYSGHSMRLGFAQWATSIGRDIKTLMEYVGWKNVQSGDMLH
jgi:hypothetical protein